MKPVLQTQFVAEPGQGAGNCLAACLASLLELPIAEVPNFAALPKETNWIAAIEGWLEQRGLALLTVDLEPAAGAEEKAQIPLGVWLSTGTYVLLAGKSPRGPHGHIVVGQMGENGALFVHDPNPAGGFLDGPPKELWALLPLDPGRLHAPMFAPASTSTATEVAP